MQSLNFHIQQDTPEHPAVGLIVLQSDESMEHELRHWLPDNVRLFHTRIPNEVVISHDSLQRMQARLPLTTALLPVTTDFKVIVYGCTSGATVIGEQAVSDAIQSVFPDAAVTNPLSALKARLASINACRIGLLTPYVPDVSAALMQALEDEGIQVVDGASFNESRDDQVARISRQSILDAVKHLGSTRGIDAVVASCTNLRTFGLIDEASQLAGVPVISSNSALAWHIGELLRDATLA